MIKMQPQSVVKSLLGADAVSHIGPHDHPTNSVIGETNTGVAWHSEIRNHEYKLIRSLAWPSPRLPKVDALDMLILLGSIEVAS